MDYIIDFKNNVSTQEIQDYLTSFGATITKSFLKFENVYCVESPVEPLAHDIVEHIVNDDDNGIQLLDITVQADHTYGQFVTDGSLPMVTIPNNDQNWWKFYTFVDPDLDASSYTTNRRGANSVVYILDSGIELTHPEFENATISNLWSFTGDFTDTKGHGTAIASVIAGETCGITNAIVKSVKIFDVNVSTKQSDMLAGLDAIYHDSVNYENIIVNCSWAISKNSYIENKIKIMSDSGIFFVVAAGNSGVPIDNVTPASMEEVLVIGSYNNNLMPSDFSNFTNDSGISVTGGETNYGKLDGWAPGELIWAAGLNGSYHNVFGTSIAAGIHSAVLAYNLNLIGDDPLTLSRKHIYSSISLSRQNLLDLSDPKYVNSVNKISTIKDKILHFTNSIPLLYVTQAKSNNFYAIQFFNPHKVQQITLKTNLPYNMNINSKGRLFGNIPNITEKFEVFSIPIDAVYYSGEIESFDFKLVVASPEFDNTQDTTGDPVLDIALKEGFSCVYESGCKEDPNETCNDDCANIYGTGWYCVETQLGGGGCEKTQFLCYCGQ